MKHENKKLTELLQNLDLGYSVAEQDTLLETARIETSAFTDLLYDRVDLIPGTKGSGKSSLFRIFVDFMPATLLRQRKVVIAHGVQAPGDPVFHAYSEQFAKLSEKDFISFWCIYLVSLAHEQFIKSPQYSQFLDNAHAEIRKFKEACDKARIPEIKAEKSLKSILEWSLHILASWRPKATLKPSGEIELDLFGNKFDDVEDEIDASSLLPKYLNEIKDCLEVVLKSSQLSLWLMVDRLDEIFQRRSDVERKALRGLLSAMRYFSSENIRVKIFLRDDMLEELVSGGDGFTALTHVTTRKADTLRWTEDQILTLVVKRFSANAEIAKYLNIDREQVEASAAYRKECFYKIFPPTVFRPTKQSSTISWIYNRCSDGRGVVTPRDVLELLISAKQKQLDVCASESDGASDYLIESAAIQYGFEQLSKHKRITYLQAEFPHLWETIEKFIGGKTNYSQQTLQNFLGSNWKIVSDHLVAIGFLKKGAKADEKAYSIPFLYRHAMNLTQGSA